VVLHYISIGITNPNCDFLSHPVDSFAVMIRAVMTSPLREWDNFTIAAVIFHRFALHIIEYGSLIEDTERGDTAKDSIALLKNSIPTGEPLTCYPSINSGDVNIPGSAQSISMESLCRQNLVDKEAIFAFRSCGQPFSIIEDQCKHAIHLFLCLYGTINTRCTDPQHVLGWFCLKSELNVLFRTPWQVDKIEFQRMWESLL